MREQMKEMVFEWLICILCASVLMIIHEMVKDSNLFIAKKADASESCFFA